MEDLLAASEKRWRALESRMGALEGRLGARAVDPADELPEADAVAYHRQVSLLDERLTEVESTLRKIALMAETQYKDPLARAYTFLSSTEPFFRREGVRLLGQIASVDPESADALIRMLRDEIRKVQEEALRGLGKAKIRAAVPAVVELLEDPSEWTRASAVDTLRKILEDVPPDAEVLEVANAVAPYLSDEGSQVREAAINAIAAFEPPWAVESLAPMLRDPDRSVRGAAIASLAGFDSPEVRTRLRAHYDESDRDDPFFSFSIAAALRDRGDDAAMQREGPRLVELATTSLERDTRVAAYRLLAKRGGEAYRPLLEQALEDPDPVIREVTREALAGISNGQQP